MKQQAGQSLVELLLGLGLLAVLAPVMLGGIITAREGRPQAERRQQAVTWMNETIETVRSIRERGWSTFSTNGTYHPTTDGSTWSLTSGTETVNGVSRSVVVSDVYRNSSGQIVTSGGTLDPSTKRVQIQVSWSAPFPSSTETTLYFTRYEDNTTFNQSSAADLGGGTNSSTVVTSIYGDGEVVLASGGYGDWCSPGLTESTVDLPKSGTANAISATQGIIFAGTGENSSGVSFARVNVDQAVPPVGTIAGTFNGYKTNDIFGDSNYAYLGTDNNSREVVIISLTTNPYSQVGYFDASGSTDTNSVYVSGQYGYMTQGNRFRIFDLSSKSGSRPQVGTVTLAGTGTRIAIAGNYAYVSIAGAAAEMQIINISNPASPSIVGQADVNGEAAYGVFVNSTGTRAYIVTGESPSLPEFFIVNTESKSGTRPIISSYNSNGMNPTDVAVVPGNLAVIVGTGAEEYQVINISNESSPVRCGGTQVNSGIRGISFVLESDGDAFSYIITGDASSELKIIGGGPGGQFTGNGLFTSDDFSLGYPLSFNRMVWSYTQPIQTTFGVQVAVANPADGNCNTANYTFVGPNGSTSAYYEATTSAIIPYGSYGATYQNPGTCFKYRVRMTATDPTFTPIFRDISVNYSP